MSIEPRSVHIWLYGAPIESGFLPITSPSEPDFGLLARGLLDVSRTLPLVPPPAVPAGAPGLLPDAEEAAYRTRGNERLGALGGPAACSLTTGHTPAGPIAGFPEWFMGLQNRLIASPQWRRDVEEPGQQLLEEYALKRFAVPDDDTAPAFARRGHLRRPRRRGVHDCRPAAEGRAGDRGPATRPSSPDGRKRAHPGVQRGRKPASNS